MAAQEKMIKVTKGLEHCKCVSGCNSNCPYFSIKEDHGLGIEECTSHLADDALSLLKAQMQEISRLKHHIDCDAAEKLPCGCVGYGRNSYDNEPCETCKTCEKYNGKE